MNPVTVTLTLTPSEHARLQEKAEAVGYTTVSDYLLALAYDEDPEVGFREAWSDLLTGNLLPLEALWQAFEDD